MAPTMEECEDTLPVLDSSENTSNEILPAVKAGMECDIKNLYQGKEDNRGRFTWTDKYPENLEKAAEDEVTARYAILIRYKKCFSDSRKSLEIDSIVVQSPLLKKVLGIVLADYPGMYCWISLSPISTFRSSLYAIQLHARLSRIILTYCYRCHN
jgi:hypothetical protein